MRDSLLSFLKRRTIPRDIFVVNITFSLNYFSMKSSNIQLGHATKALLARENIYVLPAAVGAIFSKLVVIPGVA